MTDAPRRSTWMDDPQNFERLRQNFTTSLLIHGPNMDLPDMSEKLCEFREEMQATRDALTTAQARIAELEDVWGQVWKEQDRAWSSAAQARIAELEAALALRTGADHDEDCKARRGKLCNCGHDTARRALEAKP